MRRLLEALAAKQFSGRLALLGEPRSALRASLDLVYYVWEPLEHGMARSDSSLAESRTGNQRRA